MLILLRDAERIGAPASISSVSALKTVFLAIDVELPEVASRIGAAEHFYWHAYGVKI